MGRAVFPILVILLFLIRELFAHTAAMTDAIMALVVCAGFLGFLIFRSSSKQFSYSDLLLGIPIIILGFGLFIRSIHLMSISSALLWFVFAASSVLCIGYFYSNQKTG